MVLVAALVMATASGGDSTPPPSGSDPPAGTGERISGNERIGWSQSAADSAELATFRYAAYVDGNRVELAGVSCGGASGAFTCSSRLPTMSSGAHSIELVSFVDDNGTLIESAKSATLRVTVTGSTSGTPFPTPGAAPATRFLTTTDNVELRLDLLSDEFVAPTSLAIAPDGRVFVAERSGRVRILRDGTLDSEPALIEDEVLMTSASEGGLLSIALDAQFERTHFVFAVYTVAGPDGAGGSASSATGRSAADSASARCSSIGFRSRAVRRRSSASDRMPGCMPRSTPARPGGALRRWRRPAERSCASTPTAPRRRISPRASPYSRAPFNRPADWTGIPTRARYGPST